MHSFFSLAEYAFLMYAIVGSGVFAFGVADSVRSAIKKKTAKHILVDVVLAAFVAVIHPLMFAMIIRDLIYGNK